MDQLINKISTVSITLKSKEILDYLNQWNIDKMHLLKLVIESKIGFDQLSASPENASYFLEIEESSIYSTNNYSELIMVISTMGDLTKNNLQNNNLLNKFYLFHKMLYRTANLVSNLLSSHSEPQARVESSQGGQENSIVNPLFSNNQPVANPNSIPNPLNINSQPAAANYANPMGNFSYINPLVNNSKQDSGYFSEQREVKNTEPTLKETSKLFAVKEVMAVSNAEVDIQQQSSPQVSESTSTEDDVTLGAFLKSLSGF